MSYTSGKFLKGKSFERAFGIPSQTCSQPAGPWLRLSEPEVVTLYCFFHEFICFPNHVRCWCPHHCLAVMSSPDLISAVHGNSSVSLFELLPHRSFVAPPFCTVGHVCLPLGFPSFLVLSPFNSHGEKGVCKHRPGEQHKSLCFVFRYPSAAPVLWCKQPSPAFTSTTVPIKRACLE